MRHCQNCGIENEDFARFCRGCGAKLEDQAHKQNSSVQSVVISPVTVSKVSVPSPKKKGWVAGAAVGIVLIVVICVALGGRETGPTEKGADNKVTYHQTMVPVNSPENETGHQASMEEQDVPGAMQQSSEEPESVPGVTITQREYDNMINSCNANNSGLFCARDGVIYFRSGVFMESSNSTYGLKSLTTDGETLLYDGPNWYTMVGEDELYFYDHRDDRRAKALSLKTGKVRYLSNYKVDYMVLLDGMLYVSEDGGGIYRIDPNDEGYVLQITDKPAHSLSLWDGALYYVSSVDNRLYRYEDERRELVPGIGEIRRAVMMEEGILYQTLGKQGELYMLGLDGRERFLAGDGVEAFVTDGEMVYFTHNDMLGILTVDIAGEKEIEYIDFHKALDICLVEDWIYYVNVDHDTAAENDRFQLWRVKTDGSQSGEIY